MAVADEIKHIGGNIVAGVIAGAIGTAAMTAAQRAQMKATGRSGSTTPAKAAEKVLDVQPEDKQAEKTLSQETHWAYGTAPCSAMLTRRSVASMPSASRPPAKLPAKGNSARITTCQSCTSSFPCWSCAWV
jgi:hypothetical protein